MSKRYNIEFYSNRLKSHPENVYIDEIHAKWAGDYVKLEARHGYIQWLFPLFEGNGVNNLAYKLEPHEADQMKRDKSIADRIVLSYKMMLDFFGFVMKDERTGKLGRSSKYVERFRNLQIHGHNYLRITRILKSLGYFGFAKYQEEFLAALKTEVFDTGALSFCRDSYENYWRATLDSRERSNDSVFFRR